MSTLTPAQRRALRAKAHHLDPVVSIGHHGLTPPVLHEIDVALTAHELIKIRVHSDDRGERESMLGRVCAELGAAAVQHLGKLLIVFRPAPEPEPAVERRASPARRAGAQVAAPAGKPRERRPSLAAVGERHARHRRGASREAPSTSAVPGTDARRRLPKSPAASQPPGFTRPLERRGGTSAPQTSGPVRRRAGRQTGVAKTPVNPTQGARRRAVSAPQTGEGARRRAGRPTGAPKSSGAPDAVRRRRRPTGGR